MILIDAKTALGAPQFPLIYIRSSILIGQPALAPPLPQNLAKCKMAFRPGLDPEGNRKA
jgi:hypothetical protein